MKLIGKKYIDDNSYNSLVIKDGKKDLNIEAKGNIKYKTSNGTNSFFEGKNIDDNEILINELIRYFIEYNKLCLVEDDCYYKNEKFKKISSKDRKMLLSLKENKDVKNVYKDVIEKYKQDRLNYVYERNLDSYLVFESDKASQYRVIEPAKNGENNDIMLLLLKTKNGRLINMEKEFICDLVNSKLNESNEYAKINLKNNLNNEFKYYELECGLFKLSFSSLELCCLLDDMVLEHNRKLNKQYRLSFKRKEI